MCITRFNIIMTLVGGPLTRIDAVNMIPFHSIRENLKYGHSPISWDMLYNIVMFVPFGIIYCYYQKTFCIYKAIGLSVLTTFSIEMAQFIFKTGVVDIDDLIVNTIGSLVGIFFYIAAGTNVGCTRSNWYSCNNTASVIHHLRCRNVFWRWFTKAAFYSQYSFNKLWYFRLYIFNKWFFLEIQAVLRSILCWDFLVAPCHTIENIVAGKIISAYHAQIAKL